MFQRERLSAVVHQSLCCVYCNSLDTMSSYGLHDLAFTRFFNFPRTLTLPMRMSQIATKRKRLTAWRQAQSSQRIVYTFEPRCCSLLFFFFCAGGVGVCVCVGFHTHSLTLLCLLCRETENKFTFLTPAVWQCGGPDACAWLTMTISSEKPTP